MTEFLERCPSSGLILDAACGTGKYWGLLQERGLKVFGIDQSQGMLEQAKAKFPEVQIIKGGLQEMQYEEVFDGAICMDAMEMVFPEEWQLVMKNLCHAIKPYAFLYFTVEITDELELEKVYKASRQMGLPVKYGEWANDDGYHYYPKIKQVKEWVKHAGFQLIKEDEADDYHHFLVQKQQVGKQN
jgi:SAM-dependent methyltransferase